MRGRTSGIPIAHSLPEPATFSPRVLAVRASAPDVTQFPFEDRTDFEDADRGFIGSLGAGASSTAEDGRVVWDNDGYGFLDGPTAPTRRTRACGASRSCTPSRACTRSPTGIYQVRGLDLSNMTVVEGDTGVIVIDPLVSKETAAAALALYRRAPRRPAGTAVIYTHTHVDHFGGVTGRRHRGRRPDPRPRGLHGRTPSPRTSTPDRP